MTVKFVEQLLLEFVDVVRRLLSAVRCGADETKQKVEPNEACNADMWSQTDTDTTQRLAAVGNLVGVWTSRSNDPMETCSRWG